jgi:hypothetical protein
MNGNETEGKKVPKETIQKYFFRITLAIETVLSILLIGLLVYFIMGKSKLDIYSTIGIGIIIVWIALLVLYYSWAIYFYNINLGLTDNDWKKIEDSGDTDPSVQSRFANPERAESLGLPPGTVRGTIALTVIVGGLALFIASLGRNNFVNENQILVDYFDFFKSAFLMVIAFYFGAKSLETLVSPKAKTDPNVNADQGKNIANPNPGTNPDQSSTGTI